MHILVTGGAGYIGSHMVLSLVEAGYDVVVVDNFSNSTMASIDRVGELVGREVPCVNCDIRDKEALSKVFNLYQISAVLHFAGLKAVGESVNFPLSYYDNNVSGTVALCEVMRDAGVKRLIFSSSATVYGDEYEPPFHEGLPTGKPTNPYGKSKLMIEEILSDLAFSDEGWRIAILRYFNPIGAHPSGRIGEDPKGIPNNLLPYVAQVAVGKRPALTVFGNDYPTSDGTGVRDYIHVVDLVDGHLKAMQALERKSGVSIWNLGCGVGHSVLEVVRAFEQASGRKVPFEFAPRRDGDLASCWADPSLAKADLGWEAKLDLQVMVQDTWRWQSNNPSGFSSE